MRYASVCSGIEAATLAWEPLGWKAAWFSQYDPEHNYSKCIDFPSAVLKATWPTVPNLGNMLTLKNKVEFKNDEFDLLVGGTPCQAFSVAGLRKGMDDSRGQLTFEFVRLLKIKRPRWFLWENVPGVFTSNKGADFAAFIGSLHEIGYSFSWRILDAQYCGVPQRRRRVFVVGHFGDDWRPSAAVLFERQSMPGYFKPGKETKQNVAKTLRRRPNSSHREDSDNFVVQGSHWDDARNPHPTLNQSHNTGGIGASNQEIFCQRGSGLVTNAEGAKGLPFLTASNIGKILNNQTPLIVRPLDTVRRLTPMECERLQGMPDHHTAIIWKGKPAPEGHRYKAIGNSMAVPVMHWIGKRIQFIDEVLHG